MKACTIGCARHSILVFSIDIPISVIVSFRKCSTLWFRCFTVEPGYCSFVLILVVMGSVGFVVSIFTCFIFVGDFFSISAIISLMCLYLSFVFFLHFRHGCVHSMELGNYLQKKFIFFICLNLSICSSAFFEQILIFHLIFELRRLFLFEKTSRHHLASSICLHTFL